MHVQVGIVRYYEFVTHSLNSVNETVFGVTSNDVLFSLSSDEVSLNNANRLTRLASHILQQQSFYPIFPPSTKTPSQVGKYNQAVALNTLYYE